MSVNQQLLNASPRLAFARTLFVWAKNGQIVCLSPDEIRGRENEMKAGGWRHTATIDPARWIEALTNGGSSSDMLDEIQFMPNTQAMASEGLPSASSSEGKA